MKPDQTNADFELSCTLPIEGMQTSYNWTIEVSKNDLLLTTVSSSNYLQMYYLLLLLLLLLLVGPSDVAATSIERVRAEGKTTACSNVTYM